ncbi:TPA_asm: fusion protein [Guizotia abyssinica amalgavirus 2]|nr:TPA_asm: fusion protein [Guizotia abyssinica amalgavirus 2]
MSTSGANEFRLGLTPEQEAAEIADLTKDLITEGFRAAIFKREAAIDLGFTHKSFVKHIKTITACIANETIGSALILGVKHEFFESSVRCTLKQFLAFAKFLMSKEGSALLQNAQKTNKLKRRRIGDYSVKDVALEQIFNAQRADWSYVVKKERELFGEQIDEHRRAIRRLERQCDERIKEVSAAFKPAADYIEPMPEDIARVAWEVYVQEAENQEKTPIPRHSGGADHATEHYAPVVRRARLLEFVAQDNHAAMLDEYCKRKICHFGPEPTAVQRIPSSISWKQSVEQFLLRKPLPLRKKICVSVPVGHPPRPEQHREYPNLSKFVSRELLERRSQRGSRSAPVLNQGPKNILVGSEILMSLRLTVHIPWQPEKVRGIPNSRSKFEAAVRKMIGGGAMLSWKTDGSMYRGGGNSSDALLLLSQARDDPPGSLLRKHFSLPLARTALNLPCGLDVPDGEKCCVMKNFNNEATAGPFLRVSGVMGKYGLKEVLEKEMWRWYDGYARGEFNSTSLPYLTARLGFRTKLLTKEKAWKKMGEGDPFGRAVMMLDALEQAASTPLYNVMSSLCGARRLSRDCGFKNSVVKASSDWAVLWEEVKKSACIIELDWAKFDRERPSDDILFVIDVIISCFHPKNPREERLLRAYKIMMRRALVERLVVMDGGGVFGIEGMVPSGSLWTGWLDTALNILYLHVACVEAGFGPDFFRTMCAGDDNLTLFSIDLGDDRLLRVKEVLNDWFRAGIVDEEFIIHRPPYHVVKRQACFPPEVDLSGGTSKIMHLARWEEFDGELVVDLGAGRSHRWEYRFKGCPKFLSNYWLIEGQPVRPAHDNLEKLLWPEGIHGSLDDYQAALLAMVVDNPWNHHNVNHMLMRFVIANQLRRMNLNVGKEDDVLFLCGLREDGGGPVPFPEVAAWRRSRGQGRMEDYQDVQRWCDDFSSFVSGVTSLYTREATGGIDAWLFMQIIRNETHVGEGQYGNDMQRWLKWLHHHPCTKYLKPTRGNRPAVEKRCQGGAPVERVQCEFSRLRQLLLSNRFGSTLDFALWLSHEIRRKSDR